MDIFEKEGNNSRMPVVTYPPKYLAKLCREVDEVNANLASGEQPVWDSVDALFAKLEKD